MPDILSTDTYVLASGVNIFHVSKLRPELRAALNNVQDGHDFVISKLSSRKASRVLTPSLAALVDRFHSPLTVVDAVAEYSVEYNLDAEQVLSLIYDEFITLIQEQFLVSPDQPSASTSDFTLPAVLESKITHVHRRLSTMEDTRVLGVDLIDGRRAVLKQVSRTAPRWIRAALAREADILLQLHGTSLAPEIIASAVDAPAPAILMTQADGIPCDQWADNLRKSSVGENYSIVALLDGAASIVETFAALHDLGVLHGDVHPRNVLVRNGRSLSVTLIDFGLSRNPSGYSTSSVAPRGGLAEYFSPSHSAAELSKLDPPALTSVDEQYSVGVLVYRMLTGRGPFATVFHRNETLRQTAEVAPAPFSNGLAFQAQRAEYAVRVAMSKKAEERFPTMRAFSNSLRRAVPESRASSAIAPPRFQVPSSKGVDAPRLVTRTLRLHGAGINSGLAGIAIGLARLASAEDSVLLRDQASYILEELDRLDTGSDSLFFPEGAELEVTSVDPSSILHCVPGVHLARATGHTLLAHYGLAATATKDYIDWCANNGPEPSGRLDLGTGIAGIVLGFAALCDLTSSPELRSKLRKVAEPWLEVCLRASLGWGPSPLSSGKPNYFGMAHGIGGVLFALLRWYEATSTSVDARLPAALDLLASCRVQNGRDQCWWPRYLQDRAPWPGWCHGAAGHILLWLQAWRMLGNRRYLQIAVETGSFLREQVTRKAPLGRIEKKLSQHICCGRAGIGYSLFALLRGTGDERWLALAKGVLEDGVAAVPSVRKTYDWSLFRGDLGLDVARSDLMDPWGSSMPVLETHRIRPAEASR